MTDCAVCSHVEVKVIDAKLSTGRVSYELLARRFDVSADALQRHSQHLKLVASRRVFGSDAISIVDDLIKLKEVADSRLALTEAKANKDAALLIREIRQIDEAIARLSGFGNGKGHEDCISKSALDRLQDAIRRALQDFPEARAAVIAAIDAVELTADGSG